MKLTDFIYDLPEPLIAKYPTDQRTDSRLLVANKNTSNNLITQHNLFKDITDLDLFKAGDLLVLNNTKVIPARFYGQKPTGAAIEFLLERVLDNNKALVHIKSNRSPKPNSVLNLNGSLNQKYSVTVLEKQDNLYLIKLEADNINWYDLLEQIGELPLPPYINRKVDIKDSTRYQTVYADKLGAVAAPTAGLHFDQELLDTLQDKGVIIKYITLHVGAGTFAPVRVENIQDHKMHSEAYSVTQDLIDSIIKLKQQGKNKIIAVGTTSLRCLESIARELPMAMNNTNNQELDYQDLNQISKNGDTDIFIYPGFKFKLVDCLITNFHLPASTLMMLVSAFAGMDEIRDIYSQAIANKYRFFSYGDAMWLNRKN